jgi:heptosyltransferase-2/heptosyltransferase-3
VSDRVRLAGLRAAGRLYQRSGRTAQPQAERPRSVLLIRPDHIGDLLLATPAIHALREALPGARLALLVGPWGAEVMHHNPDVDEVLTLPFPGFERSAKRSPLEPYRILRAEAGRIRDLHFDTAVVLRFDHWWGSWLAAQAGIPRRIGYNWPEVAPFLTEAIPYLPGRHEALQNARVLSPLAPGIEERLGPTRFAVTQDEAAWASRWLSEQGGDKNVALVAIHPGAGAAVKQWPVERWAEVARALIRERKVQFVVTGGPGERALAEALTTLVPGALNAAGQTQLGQLAALHQSCALVFGSDSGPLHLAVAAGAPTVHLYGPVPAAKFGPWGDKSRHLVLESRWACSPCDRLDWPPEVLADHGCIATMTTERVLAAAFSLLGGT